MSEQSNADIRRLMRTNDIKQWKIAEAVGLAEGTFCRKMRRPLDEPLRAKVMEAITELSTKAM